MKIFIETYGCQMNVSDSELVKSILIKNNAEVAETIQEADVIIFNTCSVRKHAEDRVFGRISHEISRKRAKPNLKIGVIGCMAQRLGDKLQNINNKIDFVVGVDQYDKLPEIIGNTFNKSEFIFDTTVNNQQIYDNLFPTHSGSNGAFITIMRGCNNFCTYCIVPYTRGRERSRSNREIVREIENISANFKDITLLGQNVNSYNYNGVRFPDLLKQVNNIDSISRIRFVTSHPKDLSDELISVMADSNKVCENIHLPMQSGNNAILKRMNRGYTIEHYRKNIDKLRNAMPEISISTDIIAGFPGETEDQFLDTFNAMKSIEFDYAFTFKYSPRQGTKAADFSEQIDEKVRLERLKKLIELQENITLKKFREQIGKTEEVYVEKVSKRSIHEVAGKTRGFKITVFPGSKDLIGKFVKVKIVDAVGWTLKGEII